VKQPIPVGVCSPDVQVCLFTSVVYMRAALSGLIYASGAFTDVYHQSLHAVVNVLLDDFRNFLY